MSLTKSGLILVIAAATFVCGPTVLRAQSPSASSRQAEVSRLIATLQSPEASQYDKVQACHRLTVIGTPEAVPALAALLSDEKLAHMARYSLEPMPDPAVDVALRAAMGQLNGLLQIGVINSIGMRRDAKAVDALIPLLGNSDPAVASAAAAALGRIGNPKCSSALWSALGQAQASAQASLANACLVCAERLVAQDQQREAMKLYGLLLTMELPAPLGLAATRGFILTQGSAGLPLLVEQLNSPDGGRVAMALSVARELPGTEVTKALAAELTTLPEETQVMLLVALGDREDQAALPAVLGLAERSPTPTRVTAMQVLAKLGDVSAVPLLLAGAGDPDSEVAQAAQATLWMLPGAQVDSALVTSMGPGNKQIRLAAIEALGQRRTSSAVSALNRAVSDPDAEIRVTALDALGKTVGLENFALLTGALIQAASPGEMAAANEALWEAVIRVQDNPAVARKLLAVLPQAKPRARALLMLQLAQVGGDEAMQAVVAGTRDSDPDVQANAVRALADWPDAAAVPALEAIVRATPDQKLRAVAFRGYVRLVRESKASAAEKVKRMEQASALAADDRDRMAVLAALGDIPDMGAWRLMVTYLDDPALANEVGAAATKLSASLGATHKAEVVPVLQQVLKSATVKPVLNAAREQLKTLGASAN